ncbi:MAG TPA: hypothetical protein VGZ02_03100 [Candidatus Baltobacteraceae bacterium]|jgi:hypothetical protein|nr:hypothetical protein [Candidatus Baltobacteraceae bacterium]
MRRGGQSVDLMLYLAALPVYARNLGVMLPPLVAAAIGIGIGYFGEWFSQPVGGATNGIFTFIEQIVWGFGFAVSVIFADDAWRHNRATLSAAWSTARRKAGEIVITVIGFYFLIFVAQMIGNIVPVPFLGTALGALAVWAFIYSIPAVAMGGVPAGGAFSVSLQTARRNPLATAVLTIVSVLVFYYVALYVPAHIGMYLGAGYDVARVLLVAFALGYIALIVARQYAEFAFRSFW